MTNDEIIEMARQAASHGVEDHRSGEVSYVFYNEHLMNFAKLVAQHEREACAKIVDENIGFENYLSEIIKSRGQA
jgi:hypothetical protein